MRNNIIFLFLIFILAVSLFVTAKAQSKTFKIYGKDIRFYNTDENFIVSENCKTKKNCMALKKGRGLKNVFLSRREKYRSPHPGAVICEKKLNGKVVLGEDQNGMISFCKFEDSSLIDTGSILYLASKKRV